jgi:hypothetical protein
MGGVVAWACRTPRRLILVVGVPLLLIVIGGGWWNGQRGSGSAVGPAGSGPTASVTAQVPDSSAFVAAAVKFVGVWGRLAPGQTAAQWHQAVRALSTQDLGRNLDRTDPSSLSGSTPSGTPQVRFVSNASALIAVPLATGRSVLVTVVAGQSGMLVDDVEPDVGN